MSRARPPQKPKGCRVVQRIRRHVLQPALWSMRRLLAIWNGIGCSEPLLSDVELIHMHMAAFPSQRPLAGAAGTDGKAAVYRHNTKPDRKREQNERLTNV